MIPMNSLWRNLPHPFFCLAPLADVTDPAFRRIIANYGKPDVMYTEFVSADGLCRGGYDTLVKNLDYTEAERPIIAQFFSDDPAMMEKACRLARTLRFDGVDINMGCPDAAVCKQGAGAALIKNPARARELIRAAQRGAGDLPVSVKTRIGFNTDELKTWLPELLKENLAAVIIHARTKKEMSKVPAQWDAVRHAVAIRNAMKSSTRIVGNGDVRTLHEGRARVAETGCDGVMIGRGIFGNPWLFAEYTPTIEEKLRVLVEHTHLFEKCVGDRKSFSVMKKHYKAYVEGFAGAKELRMQLMDASYAQAVESIIDAWLLARRQ